MASMGKEPELFKKALTYEGEVFVFEEVAPVCLRVCVPSTIML